MEMDRFDDHPSPPICKRCKKPLPVEVENDNSFYMAYQVNYVALDFDGSSCGNEDFVANYCETCWNIISKERQDDTGWLKPRDYEFANGTIVTTLPDGEMLSRQKQDMNFNPYQPMDVIEYPTNIHCNQCGKDNSGHDPTQIARMKQGSIDIYNCRCDNTWNVNGNETIANETDVDK